jgi:hypothetical protein
MMHRTSSLSGHKGCYICLVPPFVRVAAAASGAISHGRASRNSAASSSALGIRRLKAHTNRLSGQSWPGMDRNRVVVALASRSIARTLNIIPSLCSARVQNGVVHCRFMRSVRYRTKIPHELVIKCRSILIGEMSGQDWLATCYNDLYSGHNMMTRSNYHSEC